MDEPTYFPALRTRRLEVVDDDDVVRVVVHSQNWSDTVYVEVFTPKRNGSLVLLADEGGVSVQAWRKGNEAASASANLSGVLSYRLVDPVEADREGGEG